MYRTHNDGTEIDINGTSLQGYINCSYDELVKAFGEPHSTNENKTNAEWDIAIHRGPYDNAVAAIYNATVFIGDSMDVSDITEWHIGGISRHVVDDIKEIIEAVRTTPEPAIGNKPIDDSISLDISKPKRKAPKPKRQAPKYNIGDELFFTTNEGIAKGRVMKIETVETCKHTRITYTLAESIASCKKDEKLVSDSLNGILQILGELFTGGK